MNALCQYRWGKEDGEVHQWYKNKVQNRTPIITQRGVNAEPPQDMYFKGALFINTLRSVVNDDKRWWTLIHDFFQHFKYQNIMTEEVVAYFNQQTGRNLTPIFDQYLRHTAIPVLELKFDDAAGTVAYRWQVDEPKFNMPCSRHERPLASHSTTTDWQTMKTPLKRTRIQVARSSTTCRQQIVRIIPRGAALPLCSAVRLRLTESH